MTCLTKRSVVIWHLVFCGLFCLFVVIGMPMLFLGCNPDVDNMCRTYDVVLGTTYGIRVEVNSCQDCTKRACGRNTCTDCGPSYTCYRGNVQINYGGPGDDCEYPRSKKFLSEQSLIDYFSVAYPINATDNYMLRHSILGGSSVPECEKLKSGMSIWRGGVVLLYMAAGTLGAWIIFACATFSSLKEGPPPSNAPGNFSNSAVQPSPYVPVRSDIEMVGTSSSPSYPSTPTVGSSPVPVYSAYGAQSVSGAPSATIANAPGGSNGYYNPHYTPPHVVVSVVSAVPPASPAAHQSPTYTARPANPAISYKSNSVSSSYNSYIPAHAAHSVPSTQYEEYDMY